MSITKYLGIVGVHSFPVRVRVQAQLRIRLGEAFLWSGAEPLTLWAQWVAVGSSSLVYLYQRFDAPSSNLVTYGVVRGALLDGT